MYNCSQRAAKTRQGLVRHTALEAEMETIKALVASKGQKRKPENREKLVQAFKIIKKEEVDA